ncbi:hypothetical protein [Myceligenerans pegani]|uniref:hypothetical protein n=1 Tax=Myceligenerans pegani TaxID=2776917 RepID=UPI0018678375|nr:hypothetical protein [Myceligenerans sp. TRM 65318]MBE3017306.1 hypothetical protein [Myceligenerans sp. TRM 65318]
MRGKHKARKINADTKSLWNQLENIEEETTAERARLTAARALAQQAETARARLKDLIAARDAGLAAKVARLERERDAASADVKVTRIHHSRVQRAWDQVSDRLMDVAPAQMTNREQVEWMMDKLGVHGRLVDGKEGDLGEEGAYRLQRARGQRRHSKAPDGDHATSYARIFDPDEGIPARPMLVRACQQVAGVANHGIDAATADDLYRRLEKLFDVDMHRVDRDAAHTMFPAPPLYTDRGHPYATLAGLGAITADAPHPGRPRAHNLLRADALRGQAVADRQSLKDADALLTPWSPLPRFSRPIDAMSIRHVYANIALGIWSRFAEQRVPASADPADESTWSSFEPSPLVEHLAIVSVGLRTCVPFWLPPAQTHGYLDADPPTPDDAALIRMPFDSQLVVFAESLWLPPRGRGAPVNPTVRHWVSELERGMASVVTMHSNPPKFDADAPKTLRDAVAKYGAKVEGILLMADDEGNLRDEFTWCLAIDGAGHGLVMGRLTIPALRSALPAALAGVVMNAAAVAAWGRWHEADNDIADVTTGRVQAARRAASRPVRVLNVARMSSSTPADSTSTGRRVAPHRRRGHWRRQRYGPGKTLIRPVWVPPVLVNASRSVDITPTVYRLPTVLGETPPPLITLAD